MNTTVYTHRLTARIVLEATSPLAIGTGEKDIITDAPVARDSNGLPYIPGTSLAGIIRHNIAPTLAKTLFGYQEGDKGEGSKVIISDALLVGADGKAIDGLQTVEDDGYLHHFQVLPVRQHVRITEKGTAARYGKFDEQVVYTGTRFVFEIELLSATDDEPVMDTFASIVSSGTFRIGSGTRCGFGAVKIVSYLYRAYDLTKEADLKAYVSKTACLSDDFEQAEKKDTSVRLLQDWTEITLELAPMDFFLFSSGFGDEDADMTPVKEQRIVWTDGKPSFKEDCTLIPATSVKGALAHRVAYHWNLITHRNVEDGTAIPYDKNPAVIALFGTVTDDEDCSPAIGNVIFSDVLVEKASTKVLPHIRTDKFTGGVMDGALFQEKVTWAKGQTIREVIYVKDEVLENAPDIKAAFEAALRDIGQGRLALGGGTNRGHGIFHGTIESRGKITFN